MLRIKHILSILFLVMATSVLAQETYVIDSVCVGGERTYRRDGEPGYTYDWYIIDTLAHDTSGITGVDFTEIDGTDTTVGNEIFNIWDTPGIYDILVYVTSEHGCDTVEQGLVKVFELPGVDAGVDQTICSMEDIVLTGDTAWNYSGMYWESTGDGAFSDTFALHPTYYLGAADSVSGSVTLILTAYGLADNITCDPVVDSVTFFFSNPEIDLLVNDVLCFGDSSAFVKANITGGLAPYLYEWTGPDGFTASTDSISGLTTGTYILTVTDNNGCSTTDSTFINQPEEILLSIDSVHNLSCYQSFDGFILSSATGGTDTLIFNWTGYSGYTASGNEIYNLPADTFVVTVSDANGCEVIDTVIVTEPDEFTANIDSIVDVQCYESDNGAAHVEVTGGTAPFVYEWDNNPALDSSWVFNLLPGTHTVMITDANLCTTYDTLEITEPLPIVLRADSIDVRCGGKKPGSIDLTVEGGTPFANAPYYLFEWSDSTGTVFATTEDVDSLAGDRLYTVWVEDSLGCRAMHQVYINEVKNVLLTAAVDSAACYGDLWSIDLEVTRGRKPYTYLWTDSAGVVIDTVQDLTGVPAGIYWVTVNDKDSCDESMQFIFEEPEELLVNITADDTATCENGVIVVAGNPVGGTGVLTHQWTGNGVSYADRTDTTDIVFSGAPAGTYQLIYTVTDENNCTASDSVELEVLPAVTAYDTIQACEGEILADWNGQAISSLVDSVYQDTLISQNGCDSIAILTVSILPVNGSDSTTIICEGEILADWNGQVISSLVDSVYRDTLVNQFGCDSLISLAVTVVPTNGSDSTKTVCEGELLADWNGQVILSTQDSIYRDTLVNRYGCDSVVTLSLTVIPPTFSIDTMEICEGSGPLAWNSKTILSTVDSVYLDTLVNAAGCDSLLTMYVTILPVNDTTLDTVLCTGTPAYAWNGITVVSDKDSIYEALLTNQYGCDSIVKLDVTILSPTYSTEDTTLCEGEPVFAWNSHTVLTDRDSIYLDTLVNAAGCDSLLTLNVFINPPTYSFEDTTLCEGEPVFVWNSHTIQTTRDSVYLDTLVNAAGCDSLLTLNVFINPPTYSFDTMEICENSGPLVWNTQTILSTVDSIYTDTLVNAAGCDSILTMDVTIIPPTYSIDTMEICEGSGPLAWNSKTILSTVDSVYLDTLVNAAGCDSLLTMYVTILPVNDTTLDTVLCTGTPAYAWNGITVVSDKDSIYEALLTNQYGCDSIVKLDVTILSPTYSTEDTTLCEGEPVFAWNSHTVLTDRDSVYLDTLVNAAGCDSLLTLNVFINPPTYSFEDTTLCEGEPVFVWNNHTVQTTRDSVYLDTLVNAAGCDSLLTLNVFVKPPTYSVEDTTLCEGEPVFVWNNRTVLTDRDSVYLDTLVNAAGCDSLLTLNVTIKAPTYSFETMEICEGSGPVVWNSNTILSTVDSVYLDTLVNAAGCDSLLTMSVTILPITESFEDTILCAGAPEFVWNSHNILTSADSVYLDTLTNSYGCDSLLTLTVTIIPPVTVEIDTSVCEGSPEFAWHSHTISTTAETTYQETFTNAAGCDSVVTLSVHLIPQSFSVEDTTLCEGDPVFAWNSHIIQTDRDSVYLDTLTNAAGCDSLLTMNVTINPISELTIDTVVCEGEPAFAWNSHMVGSLTDSVYIDTLANSFGCDSIITLNVFIKPATFSFDTTSICEGEPEYAWNSHIIQTDRDSIYLDTLVNAAGCDSLLSLEVNILPKTFSVEDTFLCEGTMGYVWNGQAISGFADATYRDTLVNSYGCDSTLTLNVTIIPTYKDTVQLDVCFSDTVADWHGQSISSVNDSIYMTSLTTSGGCDSLLFLDVHILPVSDTVIDTLICEDEPVFSWNGNTVQTQNDSTYFATLTNVFGCDSSLTLNVTILRKTYSYTIDTIYDVDAPYAWNDSLYFTGGVYVDTLTNAVGCDSVLTLDLTIIGLAITDVYDTICAPDGPYEFNGDFFDVSGMYSDTLPRAAGGDSIVNLYLTILEESYSTLDTTICAVDAPFVWNGNPYSSPGTYMDTLTNAVGCDSIMTLYLNIINSILTEQYEAACESYTWTDGDGNTYTSSGIYDYIIGSSGCADTMRLHLIISPPIDLAADITNVLCYGDSTGTIDLTVSGGIAPFDILWSTGDTVEDLSNLAAGNYSVIVSDSLGCSDTLPVEITQPDSISITLDLISDVVVNGDSTGSIEVSVSGGTPVLTFEWTDEAGIVVANSEDLFNQPAGDYTLTVTDANNCTAVRTYTIAEPELTPCPEDLILTCFEDLVNNPRPATLEEYLVLLTPEQEIDSGCGIDTASFTSDSLIVTGSVYCYEEIRTYVLLDECADTIFYCEQHVIVNDIVPPTISCPPTITVTDGIVPGTYADTTEFIAAGGSFDDNCAVVSFRWVRDVSDNGTDPEIITRTYEVADYCGNVATCTQRIEVYLTADFTIECGGLPPGSYECKADMPRYNTLQQFIDDGGYAFSYPYDIDSFWVVDVSNGRTCPEIINRTYYIRNENGDIESCPQQFIIDDETPPVFTIPDKHISCTERQRVYTDYDDVRIYGRGSISDNCTNMSNATVYFMDQLDPVGSCPTLIQRVYRVRDACNNWKETIENIYIHDTIPPVVNANFPYEITADCEIPDAYTDVSGLVTDNCGPLEINYRDSVGGVDEPGVVYRIYTFSDPCNPVEVTQKITIELSNIPVFDGLSPLCQFTPSPELPGISKNGISGYWDADSIATDVPGTFDYIFYPDSGQCAGPASTTVVIVPAIDLDVTKVDQGYNPNPVGSIDLEIYEGAGLYTISWTGPDGYSASTEDIRNLYAGDYRVEVTDSIGCYDSMTVTLLSNQPELSCIPDTTIECPDPASYPAANTMAEFVAYGGSYEPQNLVAAIRSFDQAGDRDSCLSIDRYYVVEDIYGHIDTCIQRVDFYDNIPPVLIAPEGDTAECLSTIVPDINSFADFERLGGSAEDPNCELDYSTFIARDTAIIFGTGRSEVRIFYSIADFCGNVARDTSYYLITDDEAPEVFCAAITVYLDENGGYTLTVQDSTTLVDSVYDNCTSPGNMKIFVELGDITCADVEAGTQARVLVIDEAGLSAECMANITVVDTVPPEAICQDITVYLDANGEVTITADQINNTSIDNCEIASIAISKDRFDCTDVGVNVVQLIVTDIYGNTATCEANVTVVEEIPPYIACVVGDTIQLSEEDGTFMLTWNIVADSVWDECGIDTVLLDQYLLDCDNIGRTTITATAYDVNGNSSSCTAEFVIIGNTPPNVQNDSAITAVNVPVDINVVLNDYDLKTNINLSTLGVILAPKHGSVVVDNTTGIVTYTPNPGYIGTDIFYYSICDDGIPCVPECGEAIVFVRVRPANQPPVAVDDYYDVPCIRLTGNVALNDSDPDKDDFVVDPVPIVPPTNGMLVLYDDGHFEYEPFIDFTEGIDSFQYQIWDEPVVGEALYDTAWVYITRVPDNDCDGVADIDDIDDDNDGIRDVNEGLNEENPELSVDSDQDGIPDYLDIDSDNDGIVDNIEGQGEHSYIEPDGWRDDNNNGWDDRYDDEEGGYAFDLNLTDTDDDGIPDFLDSDSDNDNVPDFIEGNDDNADGIPDVVRFYSDMDRDGLDDAYDWIDGWGIPDLVDNETGSIAPLQDFDGDGWRDWRDINDEDDEYLTANEDINGNGDYSDDDLDLDGHPEYLDTEMECELFIPEGFSPNDDGVHDFFQILCIYPRYPDAKLMIFNRNGQLLWEKEKYGNYEYWGWNDAWWWGTSDNKFTLGRSGGLPAGNYIYVLLLNDGLGGVRNGTVMIAY